VIISLNSINRLTFVIETHWAFFFRCTEYLNIIQISFGFQRLILEQYSQPSSITCVSFNVHLRTQGRSRQYQ
jgi:hypothetical protein